MNDFFENVNDHIEDNAGLLGAAGGLAALKGQQAQKEKLSAIEAQLQKAESRVEKEALIKRQLADFESRAATFRDDPKRFIDINLVNEVLDSSGFELAMFGNPSNRLSELDAIRFAKRIEGVAKEFATQAFTVKKYFGEISPLVIANYASIELYSLPLYKVLGAKFKKDINGHYYGDQVGHFLDYLIKTDELGFIKLKDSEVSELRRKYLDGFMQDNGSIRIDFAKRLILKIDLSSLASFWSDADSSELENQIINFFESSDNFLSIESKKGGCEHVCQLLRGWKNPITAEKLGDGFATCYTYVGHYSKGSRLEGIQERMRQLALTFEAIEEDGELVGYFVKVGSLEEVKNCVFELFAYVYQYNGKLSFEADTLSDGCFIATAVYGDYEHPQVIKLRQFRDSTLKRSLLGRYFISFYYTVGPYLAVLPDRSVKLRSVLRSLFDRF